MFIIRIFRFLDDALCGYLREEFIELEQWMIEINQKNPYKYIGVDDIIDETNTLDGFYLSGAKGTYLHKELFYKNLLNRTDTLNDQEKQQLDAANNYVFSRNDLSKNGRALFILLSAANDLRIQSFVLYHNTVLLMNLIYCPTFVFFLWSNASLELCIEDIMNL